MAVEDRPKNKSGVGRVYGQTDRWTNRWISVWWWYLYCCGISSYLTALTVSFSFYRSFPQSLTVEYQKQLRPVTHVCTEIVYPLCLPPPSLFLSSTSTSFPVDNKYHVAMPSRDKLGQYSQTHTH